MSNDWPDSLEFVLDIRRSNTDQPVEARVLSLLGAAERNMPEGRPIATTLSLIPQGFTRPTLHGVSLRCDLPDGTRRFYSPGGNRAHTLFIFQQHEIPAAAEVFRNNGWSVEGYAVLPKARSDEESRDESPDAHNPD